MFLRWFLVISHYGNEKKRKLNGEGSICFRRKKLPKNVYCLELGTGKYMLIIMIKLDLMNNNLNLFYNYWLKKSGPRPSYSGEWARLTRTTFMSKAEGSFYTWLNEREKIEYFRLYFILFSGKYFHPFHVIVGGLISGKISVDKYFPPGNSRAINNIWGRGKCREWRIWHRFCLLYFSERLERNWY